MDLTSGTFRNKKIIKNAYLFIFEIGRGPAVRLGPAPAAAEERLPAERALPMVGLVGRVEVVGVVAAVVVVGPLDCPRHVDHGVELGRESVGAAAHLDVLGLLGANSIGLKNCSIKSQIEKDSCTNCVKSYTR